MAEKQLVYRICDPRTGRFANQGKRKYNRWAKPGKPGHFWTTRGAITQHLDRRVDTWDKKDPYVGCFVIVYNGFTLQELKRIPVEDWDHLAYDRSIERDRKRRISELRGTIREAKRTIEAAERSLRGMGVEP